MKAKINTTAKVTVNSGKTKGKAMAKTKAQPAACIP